MGNCGSSLNCNKCYANEPIKGCDTEIEINPDIAGIGVLVAFLVSAIGLFIVVIWGYFHQGLPLDDLTPTDHYVLQLFKKRRKPFIETDLLVRPSTKQKRRTQIITGFATVLGDQQLVTGIAILIAGLASRCHISMYEFNIVTYLAYFAVGTHALSLRVLRGYLANHKLVRNCRVALTIVFLVIFSFSFVVNTSSNYFGDVVDEETLNVGNALQCIFEAPHIGKEVKFNVADSVLVLGATLFQHAQAIVYLYSSSENGPFSSARASLFVRYLRIKGTSEDEARAIVTAAEERYYARPKHRRQKNGKPRILPLFAFLDYYDAFLNVIPRMFMVMGYGTSSIIIAVWFGGLKPANGLQILGFGQIVAIGLLSLTFLTAVEILDEQNLQDSYDVGNETVSVCDIDEQNDNNEETESVDEHVFDERQSNRTVTEEESSSVHTTSASRTSNSRSKRCSNSLDSNLLSHSQGSDTAFLYEPDTETARRIAKHASIYCLIETCLFTFMGVGLNISAVSTAAYVMFLLYIFFRLLSFIMATTNGIIYFYRDVVTTRRERLRRDSFVSPLASSDTIPLSSGRRGSPTISFHTIPSRPGSPGAETRFNAIQEQPQFGPPARMDTEADIGLVWSVKRKTFPSTNP